jgi:hypothetical protein
MVAAFDSTLQQFSADAVLILLVIVNAVVGWRTGMLRRVLAFAGVYVGVLAAYSMGNGLAGFVHKGDIFANAWSFVAVATVVVILFEVLGHLVADRFERLAAVAFDRVAGLLIGAATGFFQASVLFMVALAVGAAPSAPGNTIPVSRDMAANAVRDAGLAGQAIRAQPALRAIFAPVIGTDLTGHLEEGTTITAPR